MVNHFYIVCIVPCVHVFLLKIKRILMYEFYSCLLICICLNEIEYLLNFFNISLQIQLGFTMNADAFKTKTKCRAIATRSNSPTRKRPVPVISWKQYSRRKFFRWFLVFSCRIQWLSHRIRYPEYSTLGLILTVAA